MRSTIISIVALATSASAAALSHLGSAIVKNNCPDKFYLWSIAPGGSIGDVQTIAAGGSYSEVFRGPGIALKITQTSDGLWTSAPTQTFSYSLDGAQVWYDLSSVFGDPFAGKHITVTSEGGPTIDWPQGTNPGGSQVKATTSGKDVVFTACA